MLIGKTITNGRFTFKIVPEKSKCNGCALENSDLCVILGEIYECEQEKIIFKFIHFNEKLDEE